MSAAPINYSKFYGRKFQLQVTAANGTVFNFPANANQPDDLRITFNISKVFYENHWWADIDIYNLDQFTSTALVQSAGTTQPYVKQGMTATLSAGYQQGNYGVIWQGPVFQAKFTREHVTDFKITLHCLLWLDPLTRDAVNSSYAAGQSQTALIEQMVNLAFRSNPVPVTISPNAQAVNQSRGGVVFGSVKGLLSNFADDNNMQWFADQQGVNIARIDDEVPATETSATVFSPPNAPGQPPPEADGIIIGTPEQTQYGVHFRVLLDPTISIKYPAQLVNINNSQIIMQKRAQNEYLNILDQNGTYIVFGVRYYGDTRGTPWYTEIDGLTSNGGKWAAAGLMAAAKANFNHGN
jgi:hypothetical protein